MANVKGKNKEAKVSYQLINKFGKEDNARTKELLSQLKTLLSEINENEKRLLRRNSELKSLLKQMFGIEYGNKETNDKTVLTENNATNEEPVQSPRIFYLAFPEKEGFFWDNAKKCNRQQGESAFKMEVDNDGKGACFTFLTDDDKVLRNAMLNPGYLKSVCDFTGDKNGRQIEVLKSGTLHLDNEKWVVNEKDKVRLKIS